MIILAPSRSFSFYLVLMYGAFLANFQPDDLNPLYMILDAGAYCIILT